MVELSAMDTGESPAEVEAKIERMFKGQPKVHCWRQRSLRPERAHVMSMGVR